MAFKHKLYCRTLGCKLGFAVKGIIRKIRDRFEERGIELTIEQYFLLNILDNEEGLILQELAQIVDRDKSAVLRHINCLEENHFVARAPDRNDRRRKILLVTKPGMKILESARAIDKEVNDEITAHIPPEKLDVLEAVLSDIYEKSLAEDFS